MSAEESKKYEPLSNDDVDPAEDWVRIMAESMDARY